MNEFIRESFLPYCLPDITEAEISEVVSALKSGWLAKGPRTMEFEKKFADFVGAKYAVGMNSCTAALHIALLTADIGPGDEVITTPMTFAASVNTIVHTGARPVFVDVNAETGCMDIDAITEKITPATRAIVPVHYAGQACDLDRIYELADRYGLFVSEDAAHAVYSGYKGRRIGSSPKGTVSFSFYATKNLCTGEGGMLVTDNGQTAGRARMLVTHGMSVNAWNRYAKGGRWRYDIEEPGYKYNMFDIQSALGLKQLERIEEMQKRREQIAARYNNAFAEVDGISIPVIAPYTTTHNWHLYVLRLEAEKMTIDRSEFIEELYKRNIGASVHFIPVHLMSAYKNRLGYREGDFPNAEAYFNRIVSLPLYSSMTDSDADDVIDAVTGIVEKYHV